MTPITRAAELDRSAVDFIPPAELNSAGCPAT